MILFAALLLAWMPAASPAASQIQQEVMPESLGYVPITDPNLPAGDPRGSAYVAAGVEYRDTPRAKAYGAIAEYEAEVTLEGVLNGSQRLKDLLAASPTFAGGNGPLLRASLAQEIDGYRSQIAERMGKVPWVVNPFQSVTRAPFMPVPDDDTRLVSEVVFFEGRPTQAVFRRKKPEGASGARTWGTAWFATPEQAVEFRAVVDRLDAIAAKLMTNELRDEVVKLSSINRGWQNYLEHGFSQYPWESYLNGYVTPLVFGESSWYDPPNDQIVFLHPEIGVLGDLRTRDSASAEMALLVHGIGYIHYFGEENDWYLGASATVSLSDSDFGLGVGPTIHFGDSRRSAIPSFSLGLLWHDFDNGNNPALALSLDLSRLLDKEGPEGIFRAALTPPTP